ESAVDTRDRPRSVPLIRHAADLQAIDSQLADLIGASQWKSLKAAGDFYAGSLDLVANHARVPPEGIHPDFACAGGPLLQAAEGRPVDPKALKKADARLAALVKDSGAGAAACCEVWLRQFGVGARQ